MRRLYLWYSLLLKMSSVQCAQSRLLFSVLVFYLLYSMMYTALIKAGSNWASATRISRPVHSLGAMKTAMSRRRDLMRVIRNAICILQRLMNKVLAARRRESSWDNRTRAWSQSCPRNFSRWAHTKDTKCIHFMRFILCAGGKTLIVSRNCEIERSCCITAEFFYQP